MTAMARTRTCAFLGLGDMGAALALAAVGAGYPTTVWNRSPGKAAELIEKGARAASSVQDALAGAEVVVVCLFDQRSVYDVLGPVDDHLLGRTLINLTTTTPDGSRELAAWAANHGANYLDGGIMAVPAMIGGPGSAVFYSGSFAAFEADRDLLETWGTAEYFGADAGIAALWDLALLAGMYVMFAGFFHGASMLHAAGVTTTQFADRATPWLQAMTGSLRRYAEIIDGGDYAVAGQQSLEFSDIGDIIEASRAQEISTELVEVVQRFIHRQIDAGHGDHGLARAFESIRHPDAPTKR